MIATRAGDRQGKGGLNFSEIGFGTAPIGNLYRAVSTEESQATLQAAWDAGLRYYDTAPLYGFGLAETRLNPFLRGKERDSFVLSTKVGRVLRPATPDTRDGFGKWFEVPARKEVYDYSYDGVLRSFDFSLERLGVDRIDILYAHDLDISNHGSEAATLARLEEFMAGGYRALLRLREEGVIRAFGAGLNNWQPCGWLMQRGDFDIFLLAGRYTLLEQESLSFMDAAHAKGIGVVIGGPYNSGILATGPQPGAQFNYNTAPAEVLQKAARLQENCTRHGIKLIEAALHFPLFHPAVLSTIPGGAGVDEMRSNLAAYAAKIPAALWQELKAEALLHPEAPTG